MNERLHVVLGSGPVGTWITRTLIEQGGRVRVVNRSGVRPALLPLDAELVTADVSVREEAIRVTEGAEVVYQALNPAYQRWHAEFPALQASALAAARAAGARYVSIENLYMYDSARGPMAEDTPIAPISRKGEVRARMAEEVLAACQRGEVETVAVRSSDYYGPGVVGSSLGQRTFGPLIAGRPAEALGALDVPHSYAYVEDVARAAVVLGADPEACGRAWLAPHAPAATQRDVLERAFAIAGLTPKYTVMGRAMLRFGGLFVPAAGEMVEMLYQFTSPFVVDSSAIERAFGLRATDMAEGLARTIEWYRGREEAA